MCWIHQVGVGGVGVGVEWGCWGGCEGWGGVGGVGEGGMIKG